ncbi:phosphoribosylaminoimidazole-succinocarboxamide synthase [Coxiella endosymbiont of Amblyomma americanum]|nr:phosphoribosylaminoimidazole-succinocarboxamide synthase [Coxiella endosymbiont of Amblyomma americanum]
MIKRKLFYNGKAKSLYETNDPQFLIVKFRDDITAFDGEKHEKLLRKGVINNKINAYFMRILKDFGILTHFKNMVSSNESVVYRLTMIPLECVVRNMSAGSLCRRLGISNKLQLNPPLYELFLKNDVLHDPMITEDHALCFLWATKLQLDYMKALSLKINTVLSTLLSDVNLTLVDSKYEFGIRNNEIYLGDEISPDSCRIWDTHTEKSLDKDRFRNNLGQIVESYEEIAYRLKISLD